MGRGKGWTTEDDWAIKDMFEQGMGLVIIATKLGRSELGIKARIRALGLKSTPEPIQASESFEEVLSSIDAGKVVESQPSESNEIDEPVKKEGQKGKGRYKIRFLVDGLEERTASLVANNEKHAMTGLIKNLNLKDDERTYDIIRVESFEPMEEDHRMTEPEVMKKLDEILNVVPLEVYQGAMKESEEQFEKELDEMKEQELESMELPLAYYGCDGCLTVKGITLSNEETQKVLHFATQIWKTI